MKVNVTKVSATDKKKDGTPLVNKFNKPYFRVGVQTKEHGAEWINGFLNEKPDWEGKEIELDITEEEYNGKMQKKFALPKKSDLNNEKLDTILNALTGLRLEMRLGFQTLSDKLDGKKPYPKPEDEGIDLDDPMNF